jgi:hypothetical protein
LNSRPSDAGHEHANLLFEGLGTLRRDSVKSLLEACPSVKVKRPFSIGPKHARTWFKQTDPAKVSLVSGKRVLVAGGRLDSKYLITVPAAAETPSDAP